VLCDSSRLLYYNIVSILDLLFPKYCVGCKKIGDYVCDACFAKIALPASVPCLVCNRPSFSGITHPGCKGRYAINGVIPSVSYKGVVKKLIYAFKYKPYVSDLAVFIASLMHELLIQNPVWISTVRTKPTLVPIPLSSQRLRNRGYNQSEILAKELGKLSRIDASSLLLRVKDTAFQSKLDRKERKKNVLGAFAMLDQDPIPKTVLLIDDILTTGVTLFEASSVCKKAGVQEVWAIPFAVEE